MSEDLKTYVFEIDPMAAPRQTIRDRFKPSLRVQRYRVFKDQMRGMAQQMDIKLANRFAIEFVIEMPPSWSKKQKDEKLGQAHQSKPDIDNMLKAFMDALAPESDSFVWEITARKIWGTTGEIRYTPNPLSFFSMLTLRVGQKLSHSKSSLLSNTTSSSD